MAGRHETFEHPLVSRYSSSAMLFNFSDDKRYKLWRQLWFNLALSQKELGLASIHDEHLEEMKAHLNDPIPYDLVAEEERKRRHDVMAHLHVWGTHHCPKSHPILHLGATSCDITDNADCIIIKDALEMIIAKLVLVIRKLCLFAEKWKDMPTLGYTHFQSAQLTTVGKRCCLWIQDLLSDLKHIQRVKDDFLFRGLKGTTGTQASFLTLFHGDSKKVQALEKRFCELSNFDFSYPITGQTTPRKADIDVIIPLANLAASAYKMCSDIRLLAHSKQLEEPFENDQIGSSAMAYKRNPMRSERVCSLARHLMTLVGNVYHTAANQWLERSLDDSANRRINIAEAFLSADAILLTLHNISDGLVIYPPVLKIQIAQELPFLVTESILMTLVSHGGDRQKGHEFIRQFSIESGNNMKNGGPNDLIERIKAEPYFSPILDKIDELMDPLLFIGRAPEQVSQFLDLTVTPVLRIFDHIKDINSAIYI